jgi:hypothetical protein
VAIIWLGGNASKLGVPRRYDALAPANYSSMRRQVASRWDKRPRSHILRRPGCLPKSKAGTLKDAPKRFNGGPSGRRGSIIE